MWKGKFLTLAGQIVLIKEVLYILPIYFLMYLNVRHQWWTSWKESKDSFCRMMIESGGNFIWSVGPRYVNSRRMEVLEFGQFDS